MAVPTTPTVNRLQLGALIKYFRLKAGLTQEDLGLRVFSPSNPRISSRSAQNRITLIESGERNIHPGDLNELLGLLGVTDADMLELIKQLHDNTSQRGRWSGYRAVFDESFRKFVDLEEDADRIRGIAVNIAPDLLQCEAYIRALLAKSAPDDDWLNTVTEARLQRASILHREGPDAPIFHFVLCESAIRRIYGSPAIVREQIAHLIGLSRLENVDIQVVPFQQRSVDGATAVLHPFIAIRVPTATIASSLEFIYLSTPGDRRYLDDKGSVEVYDRLFTEAVKAGLAGEDARRFLKEISREYR